MRRPLFVMLIILMLIVFFLELSDISGFFGKDDNLKIFGARYIGRVDSVEEKDDDMFYIKVKIKSSAKGAIKKGENVLLKYSGTISKPWELLYSDISFFSVLEYPSPARNPGCFDYALYLKSIKISMVGSVKSFKVVESKVNIIREIERGLFKIKWNFQSALPENSKGIVMGVLFGDTNYLDEEVYQEFRENGTAHVLAVSGLHVGIIYSIYKGLYGNKITLAGTVFLFILLALYGTMSGWSPSTVRAIMMVLLNVFARFFDLRYDMLSSMSFVAILLIIDNPMVIFDPSFQMSFLAVISISFITPLLPKAIPKSIGLCLSVNLGLLCYQWFQFNYVSAVSVIANIPIIFLVGYFLPVSFLLFVFWSMGRQVLFEGMLPILDGLGLLMVKVNSWINIGGCRGLDVVSPPVWICLFLGVGVFFLTSETFYLLRKKKKNGHLFFMGAFLCLMLIVANKLAYSPVADAQVVFIDVGQGDGIHVRTDYSNVLIDGGGSPDYLDYNVGEKVLKPYFLKNGVGKLDFAAVTHQHADHYKGVVQLNDSFPIERIEKELVAGTKIKICEDVYIKVLWPLSIDKDKGQEENRNCSVFMLYYEERRILITGDLDEIGEKELCDYYDNTDVLKADILKIGHHGSKFSTSDLFLDKVNPQIAVIQVGKNNYGHPSPLVLEKLRKKGIIIYRNDKDGAIGISIDKEEMKVYKMID